MDDPTKRADLYDLHPALTELVYTLDPSEVLMGEMARSLAAVEFLDQIIQGLSAQEVLEEPEIVGMQVDGKAVAYHGPQSLWAMWLDHRKALAGVAAQVIKLNLKERALDQSMGQARMLFGVIQALLADPNLGLSTVQRQTLGRAIAQRLRDGDVVDTQAIEVANNISHGPPGPTDGQETLFWDVDP